MLDTFQYTPQNAETFVGNPNRKHEKERVMRIVAVVVALASVAACAGDVAPVDTRVVRTDSIRVEIVTHLGDGSSLPVDSLSDEPVLAIHSGAASNVIFHRLTDVTPLSDGTIAIAAS